jgi:hypothetical protein
VFRVWRLGSPDPGERESRVWRLGSPDPGEREFRVWRLGSPGSGVGGGKSPLMGSMYCNLFFKNGDLIKQYR